MTTVSFLYNDYSAWICACQCKMSICTDFIQAVCSFMGYASWPWRKRSSSSGTRCFIFSLVMAPWVADMHREK